MASKLFAKPDTLTRISLLSTLLPAHAHDEASHEQGHRQQRDDKQNPQRGSKWDIAVGPVLPHQNREDLVSLARQHQRNRKSPQGVNRNPNPAGGKSRKDKRQSYGEKGAGRSRAAHVGGLFQL